MHVVNKYLGVVEFSESAIVETELRFDRKLQEANVDQSEGDGELPSYMYSTNMAGTFRAAANTLYDDICSHD